MQDSTQKKTDMNADNDANLDVIGLAAKPAAGEKPVFTGDERLEKLLGITLSLATELAVTRERLDTVERLLESKGIVARDEIESYQPDDQVEADRNALHEDLLARIFRVLR